ncbi:MAG: hypothetical protein ACTSU5_20765 [Promethearchaeota archaeon]
MLYDTHFTIVLSQFITTVVTGITAGCVLWQITKTKNPKFFLFFTHWACWTVAWLMTALSQLLWDTTLMSLIAIPQSVGLFFLVVFLDHISEVRVDPVKVALLAAIEGLYVWSAWLPGSSEVIPGYGVHVSGVYRYTQLLLLTFYMVVYFRWSYLTWRGAPDELRGPANLLFAGAVLASPVAVLVYGLATVIIPLGAFPFVIHSIGILMTVTIMLKHPKIVYVLPFVAHRLLVIHRVSGLLLYEHRWSDHRTDKDLLSGFIHGLDILSTESFGVGGPHQFNLQDGVLLIQKIGDITVSVISSKTSRYLAACMNSFSTEFTRICVERGLLRKDIVISSDFTFGDALIEKYFTNMLCCKFTPPKDEDDPENF